MIYYFDEKGACVQSSSSVHDHDDDHQAELIKRHFMDMAGLGVVNYVVCPNREQHNIRDIYYDGGLKIRPEMYARLEGNVLHDLPIPCVIRVNGTDYACDEAAAELDLHYPAKYKVTVSSWPFKEKTFEVTVP